MMVLQGRRCERREAIRRELHASTATEAIARNMAKHPVLKGCRVNGS